MISPFYFLKISPVTKSQVILPTLTQVATLKYFAPPPDYSGAIFRFSMHQLSNQWMESSVKSKMEIKKYKTDITLPEKPKLNIVPKVPVFPPGCKAPKMIKNLRFMRGPETVHSGLIHKQYGIIALGGGRLKYGHFEMMRLTLGRKIDPNRMFLVWRIDPPWQPVTKKSQGQRMGGGKGPIDHYVTPIKAHRVIVELAGKCSFDEVKGFLTQVANILPFKAMAISQEILEKQAEKEETDKKRNTNPYTAEYVIKNNMGDCHRIVRRIDMVHFFKYV